jgi:hypothetical protein
MQVSVSEKRVIARAGRSANVLASIVALATLMALARRRREPRQSQISSHTVVYNSDVFTHINQSVRRNSHHFFTFTFMISLFTFHGFDV